MARGDARSADDAAVAPVYTRAQPAVVRRLVALGDGVLLVALLACSSGWVPLDTIGEAVVTATAVSLLVATLQALLARRVDRWTVVVASAAVTGVHGVQWAVLLEQSADARPYGFTSVDTLGYTVLVGSVVVVAAGLLTALAGLAARARRGPGGRMPARRSLLATLLVGNVLLMFGVLAYQIGDYPEGEFVVVLVAVVVAAGVVGVADRVRGARGTVSRALLVAIVIGWGVEGWSYSSTPTSSWVVPLVASLGAVVVFLAAAAGARAGGRAVGAPAPPLLTTLARLS